MMRHVALILAIGFLSTLPFILIGCNIVGPAYVLLHGPEKTPAQHTLDRSRRSVVFVDDRANVVARRSTRMQIAAEAEKVITEQGLVEEVIRSQSIMAAASMDSHDEPSSIAELGRTVGADVVIYATVDFFGLTPDGSTFQPTASLRVKIIDAVSGERLWPEQKSGQTLAVEMQVRPEDLPQTIGQARERESMLAEWTGKRLAEMFYDHVPPTESRVGQSPG